MTAQVSLDLVLPNGVILDASIFDDRNYVEIDDRFLAQAQEAISRHGRLQPEPNQRLTEMN